MDFIRDNVIQNVQLGSCKFSSNSFLLIGVLCKKALSFHWYFVCAKTVSLWLFVTAYRRYVGDRRCVGVLTQLPICTDGEWEKPLSFTLHFYLHLKTTKPDLTRRALWRGTAESGVSCFVVSEVVFVIHCPWQSIKFTAFRWTKPAVHMQSPDIRIRR